jgi:hypothetical protein
VFPRRKRFTPGRKKYEVGIFDQFTLSIKKSFEKLGFFIENGIARVEKLLTKEIETEKLLLKRFAQRTESALKRQMN